METYIYWFLLAIILVGLEMVSGTFYLLVIAIAMAVGGLAALLGVGMAWQLLFSSVTGIAGTIILRRRKSTQTSRVLDNNFDIGQAVKVIHWNDNGSARVNYRGAEWDAELESADIPRDGMLYIAAVRGSTLVLTHQKQR